MSDDYVLCLTEYFLLHEIQFVHFFLSKCLWYRCSVHKVFSYPNEFKAIYHFLLLGSVHLYLYWVVWYIWLCRVMSMDLFVSFYKQKSRAIFWPKVFVEGVYFTVDISGLIIKDQMYIGVCIYVWVLNIIPLIKVSVFMPWQCFFVVWLKIRNGDTSRNFLLFSTVLPILGFLVFHVKLRIVLLYFH